MGVSFSQCVVKLLAIALRQRQDERDRDKEQEQNTKEITIKECAPDPTPEELAEIDKLLALQPMNEDNEKNKVAFKKVRP